MDEARGIVADEEVPDDGTLLVTLRDDDGEKEAILTRLGDGSVVAFENYCMHWTDVRLDRGSGAPVRNGELVCAKHGATFERDSGICNFGPCEGARLQTVDVAVEDGTVVLVDDGVEFVRVGEAESDDVDDLSTSPGDRLGF
jgi:nitrite reductase/ring-hydroxylating ferredoxin subunit